MYHLTLDQRANEAHGAGARKPNKYFLRFLMVDASGADNSMGKNGAMPFYVPLSLKSGRENRYDIKSHTNR